MRNIAESRALDLIQRELGGTFERLARSTRNNPFFRITYTPGRKVTFLNSPIGQRPEWETEICCEKCGTRYSVIGSAYFCPCCGHNSAVNSFNDSIDSIKRMIESLGDMKAMLTKKYGMDVAETMCRSLLESTIGDMVSAFQKFASCKYEALTGKPSRVNDFQIVEKGSQLFEKATGKKYADWLSPAELDFMNMMFQRRHLLEHNNGMVDQTYLDKSLDTSYSIGQRIVVKRPDANALLDVIRKLGNGLMEIQAGGGVRGNE